MRKFFFVFTITAILFSPFISCKKGSAGAAGPTGPAGPAYTGAINGHVILYDQYGDRLTEGAGLIQLMLKGGKTMLPDSSGYYLFGGINTGNYNITAQGNGYGATMVNNIQYINDTLYQDVKLSAIPNFTISSFTATNNTGVAYTTLRLSFPSDTKARNCIIFVNNNPNVNNLPSGYLLTYIEPIAAGALGVTVQVQVQATDLNAAGIFYPDEVYYAAYSYVVNDASVYEDEATGKNVYNAVGSAIIDSAAMP